MLFDVNEDNKGLMPKYYIKISRITALNTFNNVKVKTFRQLKHLFRNHV